MECRGLTPSKYPSDKLVSAGNDPPRESIPTGGRDFGLVWSVGAGISGVNRTQQTQLTTSGNSLFVVGDFTLLRLSDGQAGTRKCDFLGAVLKAT